MELNIFLLKLEMHSGFVMKEIVSRETTIVMSISLEIYNENQFAKV